MAFRQGLDRFQKAQSSEPFNVSSAVSSSSYNTANSGLAVGEGSQNRMTSHQPANVGASASTSTNPGLGGSEWRPPEWAVDPKPGVFRLEVFKDGNVLDTIPIEKKRIVFGRQFAMCDFVLDHPSLSRQHAAVVHHKNGRIFVIDLGSVHGTFVSNERVEKDSPTELEPGQSLRFAASTRAYILQKSVDKTPLFPPERPLNIQLPPPPDKNDLEAVVAYNTMLNRLGVTGEVSEEMESTDAVSAMEGTAEQPASRKRRLSGIDGLNRKKRRVVFRDQYGGDLTMVMGFSDGADISTAWITTAKEGVSLKGQFDSLVKTTVIPNPKSSCGAGRNTKPDVKAEAGNGKEGVTDSFRDYLSQLKSAPGRHTLYGGLLGDSKAALFPGGKWAATSLSKGDTSAEKSVEGQPQSMKDEMEEAEESKGVVS